MGIEFEKTSVNIGKKHYEVLTPKTDLSELYIVKISEQKHVIFGNEECLLKLATVFTFLSMNPSYILYLNIKVNNITEYLRDSWSCDSELYDLVLLHHSVQLKIHEWKQIRDLWRKSTKQPINPIQKYSIKKMNNSLEYFYREHKDFLDIVERFNTLFLIGSSRVFQDISKDAVLISENGRESFFRFPGSHDHEHIDFYARREYTKNYKYDGYFLCIDFYDRDLWREMNID